MVKGQSRAPVTGHVGKNGEMCHVRVCTGLFTFTWALWNCRFHPGPSGTDERTALQTLEGTWVRRGRVKVTQGGSACEKFMTG